MTNFSNMTELDIDLELDVNNFVVGFSEYPTDGYHRHRFNSIEEKNNFINGTNFIKYKLSNDTIVFDDSRYLECKLNDNNYIFRNYRDRIFAKWDILKTNIAVGLEPVLTDEEISWYNDMRNFPSIITVDTDRNIYPTIPPRVKYYMEQ